MRSGMEPTTGVERELRAAPEAEKSRNKRLEKQFAGMRTRGDEARHERIMLQKKLEHLDDELNTAKAVILAQGGDCERLRDEVSACYEKCDNADTKLEVSKKLITRQHRGSPISFRPCDQ